MCRQAVPLPMKALIRRPHSSIGASAGDISTYFLSPAGHSFQLGVASCLLLPVSSDLLQSLRVFSQQTSPRADYRMRRQAPSYALQTKDEEDDVLLSGVPLSTR